ncbi:MAG: hypothetical protein M3246_04550 [Actinomycetota bacterium]|nr:hypothetical protein [Actinomycetota bacterium]
MDQGQRREVLLAARIYANTHSLQVVKEAFMELGEMSPSEVVALFEDERFRRRVKVVAWCLEHSNSPEEFEEKASEILSAHKRGESPIPEGY